MLHRQAKAQLRRRSQQVQEELELDLRILEDLAVREAADQKVQTARKEKARADAEWMKQVSASTSPSQSSGSCFFALLCCCTLQCNPNDASPHAVLTVTASAIFTVHSCVCVCVAHTHLCAHVSVLRLWPSNYSWRRKGRRSWTQCTSEWCMSTLRVEPDQYTPNSSTETMCPTT